MLIFDKKTVANYSSCAILVLLAVFIFFKALNAPLLYDEAFNASVAKNIAYGYGVATSYDHIEPINPRISTGPVVLLPVAATIWLVGPVSWVPAVATALVNMSLLFYAAFLMVRSLEPVSRLLTIGTLAGFILWYESHLWFVMMGEATTVSLLVISILLLYLPSSSLLNYLMAGLAAGLALVTKTYALVPVVGVILCMGGFYIYDRLRWKLARERLGLFLAGMFFPVFLWECYKLYAIRGLTASELIAFNKKEKFFFEYFGSGIGQLKDADSKVAYILDNIVGNIDRVGLHVESYGLNPYVFFTLLALALIGFLLGAARSFNNRSRQSLTLIGAGLAHSSWVLLMTQFFGTVRYLFPGVVLCFFGLLLYSPSRAKQLLFFCTVSIFLLVSPYAGPGYFSSSFPIDAAEWRSEDSKAVKHIQENLYKVPLAGCGWDAPRNLEYLLPGVLNFRDCYGLLNEKAKFDELAYLKKYPDVANSVQRGVFDSGFQHYIEYGKDEKREILVHLDFPVEFILVRQKFLSHLIRDAAMILDDCQKVLYDSALYEFRYCKVEKLEGKRARRVITYFHMT